MTSRAAPWTRPPSWARHSRRSASSADASRAPRVKSGRVDAVRLGETEGSACASSSTARGASPARATCSVRRRRGRRARRAHRPRFGAPARRPRPCSPTGRRADGDYETPVDEDPFEVPIDDTVALLLEAERAMGSRRGRDDQQGRLPRLPRVEVVPGLGRLGHGAGRHPRRRRASRPTPPTTTTCSGAASPRPAAHRAAGYEHVRGLDLVSSAGRSRRRPSSCWRARAAAGPAHDRPAPLAAVPPDPRELRTPHGARPRLRHGGRLRRHQLPDHRQARARASATARSSSTSSPTRRRRAAWGRSAGTTRASPRSACRSSARASSAATCPAARPRRASGGGVAAPMRADGWNRLPLIRMTNINLQPRDGMSLDDIVADTDDGLLLESQPQLVHRRPPPELPVRVRDGARDQGRQAGPALPQRDVHGHHADVLGLLRRRR